MITKENTQIKLIEVPIKRQLQERSNEGRYVGLHLRGNRCDSEHETVDSINTYPEITYRGGSTRRESVPKINPHHGYIFQDY